MKKITTLLLFLLSIFNINAAHYYIDASNYSYTPSAPTINLGDTVTWINISGFHDVNGDINFKLVQVLTIRFLSICHL